jgi:peptidoglycan/LPS O-acetylase OafA/YrhL
MSSVNTQSNFRYDINALRAIAVLGVVMFHYKVPGFGGGFCGVDIFFVISGYLMSRIIINGIGKGNFSVLDFYVRRAKRIIPALLVLVVVMSCVAFFLYFPEDYKTNEGNAASSLLFLSNIYYMLHSGYFDADAESNIFLHTWSLSVEWQFYLVYPLILLLIIKKAGVKKLNENYFLIITLLIGIASVYFTKRHPTESFYLLPSRSWEMLFGGAAFLYEARFNSLKFKNWLAIAGYGTLILSLIFMPATAYWPGKFTIIPVFATFLIIAANSSSAGFVKTQFLQLTGKISYSVYLWHWPLYVVAVYLGLMHGWTSIIVLIVLSYGLGYLSLKYIEAKEIANQKTLWASVCALLIFTGALSYFNVNGFLFKKQTLTVADYTKNYTAAKNRQFSDGTCFIHGEDPFEKLNLQSCLAIDSSKKNILLIGDSHAGQFSQTFREEFLKRNINLLQLTASAGFPLTRPNGFDRNVKMVKYIFYDFIPKHASSINGVILSANWIDLKSGNPEQLVKDLNATLKYLKEHHIKAVVLGQNETYTISYPSIAAREFEYGTKVSDKYLETASYKLNTMLKKEFSPTYIDIYNYDKKPSLSKSYDPYMFDKNHLTKYGADLVFKKIESNTAFKKLMQ